MNILYIHESVPRPDKSGCDLRLFGILKLLRKAGHDVTLLARFPTFEPHYCNYLRENCIHLEVGAEREDPEAHLFWFGGTEPQFQRILRRRYDLAILPLWFWRHVTIPDDFLAFIRTYSPSTRIAVLTDDRQGYRQELVAAVEGSFSQHEFAADFSEREAMYYRKADAVLTISEEEAKYVRTLAPGCRAFCVPFSADLQPPGPDFDSRKGLLFLADYDNFAGRDAIGWFAEETWPIILGRYPEMQLCVAGNNAERVGNCLGKNTSCIGHVPDVGSIFHRHRLFISPVRIGSGIATKNVLAMSYGLPIVTTSIGAQALGNVSDFVMAVQPDAQDFAAGIFDCYNNDVWWTGASAASRKHVDEYFSPFRLETALNIALSQIFSAWPKADQPDVSGVDLPENAFPVRDPSGFEQIILAESFLERGDIRNALRQFRYALYRLQFRGTKARYHYIRTVAGIAACYGKMGESDRVRDCTEEIKRTDTGVVVR